MIRRHISAAHICLRCQRRLGQRPQPYSTRRFHSTELAANYEGKEPGTSNGQSEYNGSEANSNGDTESYHERGVDFIRPIAWPPETHDNYPVGKPSTVVKPPWSSRDTKHLSAVKPKFYGHTGTKQVGDSVKLSGVNALGKSAEVLVLRDSKMSFYKEEVKDIDEDPMPDGVDILARIQSETGIVSLEELETNINEFKPQNGAIQTWDDFNDLVQSMSNSFAVAQMTMYLRNYPIEEKMKKVPSFGVGLAFDMTSILGISAWMPTISPIKEPIDDNPLCGYSTPSYTPKQNLAARILRECWRVEITELADGVGEVDVQINENDLELLINLGYIESMMKQYYLTKDEKIEVFLPRRTIRITTNREKAAFIITDIESGVQSICRETLELKELCPLQYRRGWERRILTNKALGKLGELTRTEIRRQIDDHWEPNLFISSIVTNPDSKLSNRVDIVKRLLLDLARHREAFKNPKEIALRNFEESSDKVDLPGAFVRFPGSRELSWHERLRTWSRWTTATPKSINENHSVEKIQYKFPFDTVSVNLLGVREENSDPEGAEYLWSHVYSPTTLIKAGTVLHNISVHRFAKPSIEEQRSGAASPTVFPDEVLNISNLEAELQTGQNQIFSAQAPNLSGLFQSDHIDNEGSNKPTQEIVMYFKPNPWALCPDGNPVGHSALDDFPPIEMSFTIDAISHEVKLREVQAIVSTETALLMLPELKADLQFERKIRSKMLMKNSELESGLNGLKSSANAVKDFVNNSQLDLSSDRQLETPPKLVLPIAKHLCTPRIWDRMVNKPELGVSVEYLFARLEYRKTAVYNFDNHEICCTSIEAGKAGGSRLELSLTSRSMPNQDEMNKTMEAALKIVDLMDMKNITTVYGQIREVYPERKKEPVLGPDDFKFVPRRPSDFLQVRNHYALEEEKRARFDTPPVKEEDDDWSVVQPTGQESHPFKGRG